MIWEVNGGKVVRLIFNDGLKALLGCPELWAHGFKLLHNRSSSEVISDNRFRQFSVGAINRSGQSI